MIYNSSSDPVLIKKINLKIWSLRDEIESRINDKIEAGSTSEEVDILEIQKNYSPKASNFENVLALKPNAELDTSEDEMARAMAGEEISTPEEPSAPAEEINPSNVVSIDQNIINISFDLPNISEEKISKGKTVLSEITMDKMFFFTNKAFTEGQSIVIQFCIPRAFVVNADILYCRTFNLKSRIISQNNFTHRALIRFNFLKEGERALLRQFLQSVEVDTTKIEKKKDSSDDDSDSDFGGDDFGL